MHLGRWLKLPLLLGAALLARAGQAQPVAGYRSRATDSLRALLRRPQLADSQRVLAFIALGQEYLFNDDAASLRAERQGLALAQRAHFTRGELILLGDLARTSSSAQALPQAERWAQQMLRRAEQAPPRLRRFRVVALQTLANVAVAQQDLPRAARYLRQAQALIPQVDAAQQFPLLPLVTYYGLGELYTNRVLAAPHPADSLQQLAYFYTSRFAAQARRSARYDMLAAAYLQLGQLAHAAKGDSVDYYFGQATALFHRNGYGSLESNAYQVWSEVARQSGRYAIALAHASQALRLAQVAHSPDKTAAARSALADALAATGQGLAAYRQAKLAQRLHDSVEQVRNQAALQKLQVQFDTHRKETQIRLLTRARAVQQNQAHQQRQWLLAAVGALVVVSGGAALVSVLALRLRRSRAQLASQNEELTQTRAAQDRLYALVAHDLRSPVVAFTGLADLLRRYVQRQDTDKLASLGDYIRQSAQKLSELLDNLLNWALSQRGELVPVPQPLRVQALLAELADLYQAAAQAADIRLVIDLPQELTVLADPDMTRTILRNLIGNALQATPQGGLVTLSARPAADCVQLQVADTGAGLSPEVLRELATGPARLHVAQERGAGLGLLLSRAFAQAQGGSLRLLNAPAGPGLLAQVALPAAG